MKKTIYLTILTIVTVFCIIIGSIMHLGLFRLSLNPFRIRNGWKIEVAEEVAEEIADEITDEIISEANEITTTEETADAINGALKDISEIDINCDMTDLSIVSGKKFDLLYRCSDDDLKPVISTQDGTLMVTQASSGWRHRFGHHSDSHHLISNPTCELTITIPEEVSLKSLRVQLDLGNVKCENCDIEDATIDLDVGDVSYQAKDPLSECDMTLVTDVGEIVAFGESQGRSFSKSGQHGSLEITTNVGNITVK